MQRQVRAMAAAAGPSKRQLHLGPLAAGCIRQRHGPARPLRPSGLAGPRAPTSVRFRQADRRRIKVFIDCWRQRLRHFRPLVAPPAHPMNQARILIVEDEVLVARDIAAQLEQLGYEVAGRTTRGEEAIELADRLRPDLVLMDIQLAGEIDGSPPPGRSASAPPARWSSSPPSPARKQCGRRKSRDPSDTSSSRSIPSNSARPSRWRSTATTWRPGYAKAAKNWPWCCTRRWTPIGWWPPTDASSTVTRRPAR